ncbi:MAG: hypothetical protein A2Z97_03185 [Bdellovibrionales bacterium GWB1_52_6]|nr:MAG: hypothetical protein A2Z97_03185 [Bdellovibrionales bacterium GWB1_52_6]OFZ04662.1 MAG: hypothetical protein A2X97_13940 [Bdellovibrionales bacterium GWA1_52_35]HCM39922.1 hypothetical protein [Bdellovibrionales bacterium]
MSCLLALSLAAFQPAYAHTDVCSYEETERALKYLNQRAKIAALGQKMWADGIPELRANVQGTKAVAISSRLSLAVGVAAAEAALFLTASVYRLDGISSAFLGGTSNQALFAGLLGIIPTVKAVTRLDDAASGWTTTVKKPKLSPEAGLTAFEKAHKTVAVERQKYDREGNSRLADALRFGGASGQYAQALLDEALAHEALYAEELNFIKRATPVLKAALNSGACKNFAPESVAEANRKALKATPELIDRVLSHERNLLIPSVGAAK